MPCGDNIVPFAAGIVVMLGAMAILGLKFNFMNVFLRSIGYASAFGVGISALAAITLLPAILTIKPHPVRRDTRHTAVSGANTVESDPQI